MYMEICKVCHLNTTEIECGYCKGPICKKCLERCDLEMNEWYQSKKDIHSVACPDCYEFTYTPLYQKFLEDMQMAQNMPIWPKTYRGKIPILNQSSQEVHIKECADKKEVVLKLAFQAVELNMNALKDVNVAYEKRRNHGYQKMIYSGTAKAIMADHSKLIDENKYDDDVEEID